MKFNHCLLIPLTSLEALRSQMEFKTLLTPLTCDHTCAPTVDVVHAEAFGLVATVKMSS